MCVYTCLTCNLCLQNAKKNLGVGSARGRRRVIDLAACSTLCVCQACPYGLGQQIKDPSSELEAIATRKVPHILV